MRSLSLVVVAALLTAGCLTGGVDLQLPEREEPKSLAEALANLRADAVLDLDAALVIANAHGDVIAAACWPALKQFFTEQTGTGTPTVDQVRGVFSAWEKARVERIALEGKAGTGVKLPDYLKLGCAALVQDERLFALRLAALIAGASVGVPGLGNLPLK